MICCCGSFGDHEKYSVDIFSVRFTGQPYVLVWFNIFVENFYKWQSHGWCWCMTIDNVQLKREIIGQSRLCTQICRGVSPENSRNKIKAIKTNIWTLFCPINTPKLSCFDLIKIFTRYLWFSEILSILAWADLTFFIRRGIAEKRRLTEWRRRRLVVNITTSQGCSESTIRHLPAPTHHPLSPLVSWTGM